MKEGIEIYFDDEEGHLRLDCDEEEFRHIQDLVVSEASTADRIGPFLDSIRSIAVRRKSTFRHPSPTRSRTRLRILLVWLVLSVSLVIQSIGLVVVLKWLLRWGD